MQRLAAVNQPIVLAAIHGKAGYLLTDDVRHFDHLLWKVDRRRAGGAVGGYLSAGVAVELAFSPRSFGWVL